MSVNISKPKLFKYLGVILNEFVDFTETALKDRLDEQGNIQTVRLTGIYLYMYYNVINNVCVYIYAKGKKLCWLIHWLSTYANLCLKVVTLILTFYIFFQF